MIDPESGARQWDVLVIGGKRSPGVVRLSGPGLGIGWDIQAATGLAGAITRRIGEPLKEFDAEFELSNELDENNVSDFDLWDEFQARLEATATRAKPYALDVYHPDLARVHITAVTIKAISLMTLDGKGGGKIKVSFIEFRPPKPSRPVPQTKTEGDRLIDNALGQIAEKGREWKELWSEWKKP